MKQCPRLRTRVFMRQVVLATLMMALVISPALLIHASSQSQETKNKIFNPRDPSGVWWVEDPGTEKLLARGSKGDASKCQTCHLPEHTMPEPPLTPWAKENLTITNQMSNSMMGMPQDSTTAHAGTSLRQDCDPIGVPAQFWYSQLSPFEFVVTPGRIFQFFEAHHEWRTIWINRPHPKNLDPSYMGDSTGKWEGKTLVVDTIGYNGKDMIEPVGVDHLMSDAFHLVERWQRVSPNKMELDVTYYDPKVWGDKPWGGLKKTFIFQPNMQLMESFCSIGDNAKFGEIFTKPFIKQGK